MNRSELCEPHVTRRLTALSVVLLLLLPAAVYFGAKYVFAYYIEGNIAWSGIEDIVNNLIEFAAVIPVFAGYALAVYAILSPRRDALRFRLIYIAAMMLIPTLSGVFIMFMTVPADAAAAGLLYYLFYAALNLLWEALRLAVVLAVCSGVMRRNADSDISLGGAIWAPSHPVLGGFTAAVAVWAAFGFAAAAFSTVYDLVTVGMPVGFKEVVYLLTPYLKLIIHTAVGYFTMLAVALLIEKRPAGTGPEISPPTR